jgi:hypothetical protein
METLCLQLPSVIHNSKKNNIPMWHILIENGSDSVVTASVAKES